MNYNSVKTSIPGFMQGLGNAAIYDDKLNVATALVLNDTVTFIKVNGGTRLSLLMMSTPAGLGTGIVFKIGYKPVNGSSQLAAVDNYFGSGITGLAAATVNGAEFDIPFEAITFNEDVYIFGTVTTAPGSGGTGVVNTVALGDMVGIK